MSKGYGDRMLIDDLSFKVPPGAIVGVIGPNGAGKTTLFKLITGKEKPKRARSRSATPCRWRSSTRRANRCPTTRPRGRRSGTARTSSPSAASRCRRAHTSAASTSRVRSAEDRRRALRRRARPSASRETLLEGGDVLLLDEPSNDLDVETLRALEDALLEFAGSALVISHDRWFLDRIATHILSAEDDSQWFFFSGNYTITRRTRGSGSVKMARAASPPLQAADALASASPPLCGGPEDRIKPSGCGEPRCHLVGKPAAPRPSGPAARDWGGSDGVNWRASSSARR